MIAAQVPMVQLQFHAAPEEGVTLALRWATEHGLTAVLERFFPSYQADPFISGLRTKHALSSGRSTV
jgi:hypothetical protein